MDLTLHYLGLTMRYAGKLKKKKVYIYIGQREGYHYGITSLD